MVMEWQRNVLATGDVGAQSCLFHSSGEPVDIGINHLCSASKCPETQVSTHCKALISFVQVTRISRDCACNLRDGVGCMMLSIAVTSPLR